MSDMELRSNRETLTETRAADSSHEKAPPSVLRLGYIYISITLLFLNYFLAQYDKFVLSYFQDSFSQSLSLTPTQYAILSGYAPGIVYAMAALPVAFVSDYLPRARVWTLTAAALWWSLCVVFQSVANNFVQVFLARVGMGIGQAAVGPLSISLISDFRSGGKKSELQIANLSTRQVTNAFLGASIFYVGVYVGEAVSGQIATAFRNTASGWRIALRAIGITGLIVAAVLRIWVREPPRHAGLVEQKLLQLGQDVEPSISLQHDNVLSKFRAARVQLRATVSHVARLRSFWLIVLSASLRQLSGNVFGYYMPTYLANTYPSSTNLLSRYGIIAGAAGSASVVSGGILTAALWKRTKLTPLYLTAIGGMVSSMFVLLMIFSRKIANGDQENGIKILYGSMSAAYITAETWLGILEMLVALLLPAASKTFGLAIFESIQVLVYSSGPEIIGLALRNTGPGSQTYTRTTRNCLAVIITVGYWLAGIGLLGAIPLLKQDLSAKPIRESLSRRRKAALLVSVVMLLAFVVALFVSSIVLATTN